MIKKSNKSCLDTYEPNDENSIFYEEKINFSIVKMNCTMHYCIDFNTLSPFMFKVH